MIQRDLVFLLATILLGVPSSSAIGQEFNVYRGLLHAHTGLSNGVGTPDEAYQMARGTGLDFFAITEHNNKDASGSNGVFLTPTNYAQLRAAARAHTAPGQFLALFGQEISTIRDGNHVNIFNADELMDTTDLDYATLYSEWLTSHSEVPFIQFDHPKINLDQLAAAPEPNNHYGIDEYDQSFGRLITAADEHVALLEIIDGLAKTANTGKADHIGTNQDSYLYYLNQGFHIGVSVGQDNHGADWGHATHGRIGCWAKELTVESVYESLGAMRTFASEDEDLELWLEIDGVPMGGTAIVGPSGGHPIEVSFRDPSEPEATYLVELFYDDALNGDVARAIRDETVRGDGELAFKHRPSEGGYYFVKITQRSDHRDIAWTSPIWVAGSTR